MCTHPHTHIYTCTCTPRHIPAHTCTRAHTHIHMCIQTHTHTYTCIYTHLHTHTHTPAHIHTQAPAYTHTFHFPVLQTVPLTSHFHTQDRQLPFRLSNTDWETSSSLTPSLTPHPSPPPSLFLSTTSSPAHPFTDACMCLWFHKYGKHPAPAPLGLTVQRDDRRSQTVVRTHGYGR